MRPNVPPPRRALAALGSAIALLGIGLPAGSARGQAEPMPEAWAPSDADLQGWDWARIDSGEWIKGELMVLQRKTMSFDSDEFDELEVDWEDVKILRLARPRVFRREGNQIYRGSGELRDGILRIRTEEGETVEVPQAEVVSITYTEDFELQHWMVKIGANLAARSGNTDQQDVGINALVRRDATFTRWENRYNGTLGRVDGKRTTNNHRASTLIDWMVTNRFFVRVPSFEFYADQFQNIDARYTVGAGVGYEPIDNDLAEFRASIGAAGQVSEFPGGQQDTDAAMLFSTELSLDLPRDIDFDLKYSLQLLVTDLRRTAHSTSGILSFEVWDPIDLDVGAYWDRIENPEPTVQDGVQETPKSDDFRLTVGLSVNF